MARVLDEDGRLRYKVADYLGLDPGPDRALPEPEARLVTSSFESRSIKGTVGYDYSLPDKGARGRSALSL